MTGVGGWSETDNRAISVQLNLTGTATGTELGKRGGKGSALRIKKSKIKILEFVIRGGGV